MVFVLNLCMLVLVLEGYLAISVFILKQIGAHAKFSLDYLIFFKKVLEVQPLLHQALTYPNEVLEKGQVKQAGERRLCPHFQGWATF